jgi:hypothetical protein
MSTTFDPKRVSEIHLPNFKSPHLMVRGNLPLIDGKFAYREIENTLDMTFSDDRFLCVSLIDNTGERGSWAEEFEAFQVSTDGYPAANWPPYLHQPDWSPRIPLGNGVLHFGPEGQTRSKANLVWWPFEGMSEQDTGNPEVFLKSPGWNFGGLVEYLHEIYHDWSIPSSVLYLHCMLGADRTGALVAGLMIRSGMDVGTALQIVSQETAAGAPSMDYQRLVRAYARSLPSVE